MNCELIFYLAKKTNLCEKALEASLKDINLKFRTSLFATSSESLGELVIEAFEKTNVVFILGGLGADGKSSIENVLSKALANKHPDDLKKLKNPLSSADGYLIRQGGQLMVVLPDEPRELEAVIDGPLKTYLLNFTEI